MTILPHPHDWSGAPGGYQCSGCSAFVTDAQINSNPAPSSSDSVDPAADHVWYSVVGGA